MSIKAKFTKLLRVVHAPKVYETIPGDANVRREMARAVTQASQFRGS